MKKSAWTALVLVVLLPTVVIAADHPPGKIVNLLANGSFEDIEDRIIP